MSKLLAIIAVSAMVMVSSKDHLTSAAAAGVYSNQDPEGDEGFETNSGAGIGQPNHGSLSSFVGGHRSLYMDPAFVPYIHPRLVYEEEIPPQEFVPSKRAAKGMLVDVVDFVTKGSSNRNQRVGQGQDMRSSGKK